MGERRQRGGLRRLRHRSRGLRGPLTDKPLDETFARIKQHWGMLARQLQKVMPRAEQLSIDTAAGRVAGVLRSANSVLARRQHGGASPAAPLLLGLDETARYRVGYMEEWEERSGSRPLRFRAANLTFFISPPNDAPAIQLFRAEWPGLREWTQGVIGYQSPEAGHPHWQFDALDHYMSEEQRRARVRRALGMLSAPREAPEEFGPGSWKPQPNWSSRRSPLILPGRPSTSRLALGGPSSRGRGLGSRVTPTFGHPGLGEHTKLGVFHRDLCPGRAAEG